MFSLINAIARLLSQPAAPGADAPVRELFETAGARAGHDLSEARALRAAAQAYMRVVR
ncbi:hypothetical protein [Ramlibacter humi]|uniref:hypothetical protein n=1 Tax=Ramlibacter humi TaxID=2530451 RepID=UPI0014303CBA|nr:hypothetical protein [Ramlibacter humi]